MAHNPDPQHKTFGAYVREWWPIFTFVLVTGFTGWQGFSALEAKAADNANEIEKVQDALAELKATLALKAAKFLTDNEFARIWDELRADSSDIKEIEDKFNALLISDERINSKIELEVEKIRREIQSQSIEQTRILNQILQKIDE